MPTPGDCELLAAYPGRSFCLEARTQARVRFAQVIARCAIAGHRRFDNNYVMTVSWRRHEDAAARHEKAAVTHERAAAFWNEHGNPARADLHRDAAVHEHAGAALERRWADLIASEEARDDLRDGQRRLAASANVEDREADVETREVELEVLESQLHAREQAVGVREWAADERDQVADERDLEADAREDTADRRESLADEREGTAEAREIERLARYRQREERDRAATRRDRAAVMREEAAAERDPEYRTTAPKRTG
jgi:hypothetical protein